MMPEGLQWKQWVSQQWRRWLNRRIPSTRHLTLSHQSIFIVPTKVGLLFLLLLLVMLVTAINYQSSLIYVLTFWLFSVALVSMLQTFRNLAKMQISAQRAANVFAGDTVPLTLHFHSQHCHSSLMVNLKDQRQTLNLMPKGTEKLTFPYPTHQRGRLKVPRFRIDTLYPFGLFCAWSWVKLDFDAWVYPAPVWHPWLQGEGLSTEVDSISRQFSSGQQDFSGLRSYQAGDSLRRIAWKQLARGKGLVSKEFEQEGGISLLFRFNDLAGIEPELRLSHLCAWILKAHQQGWNYGLELPSGKLEQSQGETHLELCLLALAKERL